MAKKINVISILITMIFCFCLLLPFTKAQAAESLRIYRYDMKKEINYQDLQVKVNFNGQQISKTSTPGIIIDNIALVSYKDIFVNSLIKADYTYSDNELTLTKNDTTIRMMIGSKTAYVNGVAVQMPVAPIKVKYLEENITKVLIPSRFVATNLGYEYTWTKSTATVDITKNALFLSYSGKDIEYTSVQGNVTVDNVPISLGDVKSIIIDNVAMLRAKKVFSDSKIKATYLYDKATKTVTLTKNENTLVMTINSTTAFLNGKKITLDYAPIVLVNRMDGSSCVMVPGRSTATSLGLDYVWDTVTKTSVISTNVSNSELNPPNDEVISFDTEQYLLMKYPRIDTFNIYRSHLMTEINDVVYSDIQNNIVTVSLDYSKSYSNAECYQIYGTNLIQKATSSKSGLEIKVEIANSYTDFLSINAYGQIGDFVNQINKEYNAVTQSTIVTFYLKNEYLKYDMKLSETGTQIEMMIYEDYIKDISFYTNENGDCVMIEGVNAENVSIMKDNLLIKINMQYTFNAVGYQSDMGGLTKYINNIYIVGTAKDYSGMMIYLSKDTSYYTVTKDNKLMIYFGYTYEEGGSSSSDNTSNGNNTNANGPLNVYNYQIIIPKPNFIKADSISHEDYYTENEFVIRIDGDYTAYLNKNLITTNSSYIDHISVSLTTSNQTEIQVKTTKLMGYDYVVDDDYIFVRIGNPKDIYPFIAILDPGHGGEANGAIYNKVNEKDLNFKMLYSIGKKYFNNSDFKVKVYYSRWTDVDVSLKDRAALAKKYGADIFVSLHMNANTSKSPYGTEVYYSDNNNKANSAGLSSQKLANILVDKLSSTLETYNRGAKSSKYTVVHSNTVPAVLIELGFMSNNSDFALLTNRTFQEKAVKCIYDTLCEVAKTYKTR